jgi:SAM-dependent methyltransferase
MAAIKDHFFDENRQHYWNRAYTEDQDWNDLAQNWLEKHGDILASPSHILDMGCGIGVTAEYLISRGHTVIATDISDVALRRLQSRVPGVATQTLDFTLGLPWQNETFDHVVANLCLHYFDIDTTKRVAEDIGRVLKRGGILLARVNSIKDTTHGYGKGTLLQPNYYLSDGHYKRFFDRESIEEVFQLFELQKVTEGYIDTNRGQKHLYEIIAKRPD